MTCFKARTLLLFGALLAVLLPAGAGAMNFEAVEIHKPDWLASLGWDANAHGDVVGYYVDPAGTKGFRYRNGRVMDVKPPGWSAAVAYGISDNGNIAGFGIDGGVTKGFVYSGGTYTPVAPAGWTNLQLWAVNDAGQTTGSGTDGGVQKGVLCSGGTCTAILPTGWTSASCRGLNSSGQVACSGSDGTGKGFIYDDGVYTDLLPPGQTSASAVGINDSGQVVGMSTDGATDSCFRYDNGSYTLIPPPPDHDAIMCQSIDEHGAVAGLVVSPTLGYHTAIWHDGQYHLFDAPAGSLYAIPFGKMRNGHFTGQVTGIGVPKAFALRVSPAPDLKAGPYDGPGSVGQQTAFSISASLAAGIFRGEQGEYWLFSQQPSGTWSYDAQSRSWQPGVFPAATGPLRNLSRFNVFTTTGLPAGLHTFILAVDRNVNGVPDAADWDDDILYFFVR